MLPVNNGDKAPEWGTPKPLLTTAKGNGLEPHRYLLRVIERVPSAKTSEDYGRVLPQYVDLSTE